MDHIETSATALFANGQLSCETANDSCPMNVARHLAEIA
jgi:hypothetical protein